jgi:hypothetical protein
MTISKIAQTLSETLYRAGRTKAESVVLDTGCISFAEWTQRQLDDAFQEQRDISRHQVGEALIRVADDLLHDPTADAIDGHVSAVMRELGAKLKELKGVDLIEMGLTAMVEEIRAEQAASNQ